MDQEELKSLKGIRKVTVLTAYDYQMARIQDRMGIDMILVGDSLGMVVFGYADTKQVTMRDMIRHTEAVARGVERALVVSDLPIGSFGTVEDALENANRLLEAGAQAVKIEGNHPDVIRGFISSGIPVMAHLGLLPQTAEVMKVKGKKKEADKILSDAFELDGFGVFSIVLECVPMGLAKRVTESVEALTIGIGAGVHCDGQVLVVNDILGMDEGYSPRHSNVYADLNTVISDAMQRYIEDVKASKFPTKKQSFR